jgi:RNA polymerase sigma-70 factor (ECF subfamily)
MAGRPDYSEAFEAHVWEVHGFLAYRLGSRTEAEDLTQETFERALKAWGRFDPRRASMRTWLLAIARNLLIDHYRARGVRQEVALPDDYDAPGAEDQFDLGMDADLANALASLGQREREIIALRFGGDLSGPEVAELTGLSLANVQQILSRSLRRLRAELDPAREAQAQPVLGGEGAAAAEADADEPEQGGAADGEGGDALP